MADLYKVINKAVIVKQAQRDTVPKALRKEKGKHTVTYVKGIVTDTEPTNPDLYDLWFDIS